MGRLYPKQHGTMGRSLMKKMNTIEAAKKLGIDIPEHIILTKNDWKDLFITLAKFKFRVLLRHYGEPR